MSINNNRLYRSQNKVLGGVCGGIGNYIGIDPLIVRILFAVLLFGYGIGFITYFILWALVPEEPYTP